MSDCPRFEDRQANYPIDAIFLRRWSQRAMSGEAITSHELFTILEAGRWAPSARNAQPWRFLYALPDSEWWPSYLLLLNEGHRQWVVRAGALVLIVAKRTIDPGGHLSRTYSFDAGGACQNACLQASMMGLVSHVVQSFDSDTVRSRLAIPEAFSIEFMLVLGRPGNRSELPSAFQAREVPPPRRGLAETAFEGCFPSAMPQSAKTSGAAVPPAAEESRHAKE